MKFLNNLRQELDVAVLKCDALSDFKSDDSLEQNVNIKWYSSCFINQSVYMSVYVLAVKWRTSKINCISMRFVLQSVVVRATRPG